MWGGLCGVCSVCMLCVVCVMCVCAVCVWIWGGCVVWVCGVCTVFICAMCAVCVVCAVCVWYVCMCCVCIVCVVCIYVSLPKEPLLVFTGLVLWPQVPKGPWASRMLSSFFFLACCFGFMPCLLLYLTSLVPCLLGYSSKPSANLLMICFFLSSFPFQPCVLNHDGLLPTTFLISSPWLLSSMLYTSDLFFTSHN